MSLTLEKIFEAKNRIAPYTTRTPLIRLEKLDEYLGCQVYLKAECMQITGAFKLRGAVNKIRMLTPEQLAAGSSRHLRETTERQWRILQRSLVQRQRS